MRKTVELASTRALRQVSVALITLFACVVASTYAANATGYAITDLGSLPGDSVSHAGATYIPELGGALNNSGQAVGLSSTPSGAIATLFTSRKTVNMNTLAADVSTAAGISGLGQAAGYNIFYGGPNCCSFRAFVYSNGTMMDIHSPTLFPQGTQAWAINSSGQVVGQGYVTSSNFHAFLYSGGRMIDLNRPGSSTTLVAAYSINDAGQIIGAEYPGATFLYTNGTVTHISCVAGRYINNNSQIVGMGSKNDATVFSNGICTDLGMFPGAVEDIATGINSAGQIVGTAIFPQTCYCHPPRPPKHVGWILSNGTQVDLNTLIPANSGLTIIDAIAINDSGQILGNATNLNKQQRAVLLTPQ